MYPIVEKMIILRTAEIFSQLPDSVLAEVAAVVKERELGARQRLFNKGDLGNSMYIIARGKVRVHAEEKDLAILAERQMVGEMAVVDMETRSASVTALEETTLFELSHKTLFELVNAYPEISLCMIRDLCRRIRAGIE